MNYKLSIDRIEYVLPKKKQSIRTVSDISGINVDELDEHLGFTEKYITDEETSLDLATDAVYNLMADYTISPEAIDYIIFAHSGIFENGQIRSPSAKIQALIKANKAFCFEIINGCNSANAALHLANSLLSNANSEKNILIVVSDTLSKYVDFTKKNIMHFYMYSDGAAAILVNNYGKEKKLISSALYTDGKYADISTIRYKNKLVDNINHKNEEAITPIMDASISEEFKTELYNSLVSNYIKVITKCVIDYKLKMHDIKFLFLSQNSKRVISEVLSHFNFTYDQTLLIGRSFGHVGAIDSIIAFKNSLISGKINTGDYVILAGTGIGFHWGAHLIQV